MQRLAEGRMSLCYLTWCKILQFLDGATVQAVQFMNKVVRTALAQEQHIYTVDKPRFIHGSGHVTIV